jgi:hypothetical protein
MEIQGAMGPEAQQIEAPTLMQVMCTRTGVNGHKSDSGRSALVGHEEPNMHCHA